MGNVIKQLSDNLVIMLSNIDDLITDAVEREKDSLEEIQANQMQLGKNSEGSNIGKLRSPAYSQRKKNRGGRAPFMAVDLKATGAFQRKITAKVAHSGIHLDSTDGKTNELEEKYNRNGKIFGYNEESKEVFSKVFAPVIRFQIRRDILK